jgi:hypothetical protein
MSEHAGRRGLLAPVFLLLAFLLVTMGPVLAGLDDFSEKSVDQDRNHLPVIRAFAASLPDIDLLDYDSATTPGMHIVLALMVRAGLDSETSLQLASCLFGAALVLVAWWFAACVVSRWTAVACVLPLAASPYVLGNSIWVMTDNLSLTPVAVIIGLALFRSPSGPRSALSGVMLVLAVLVRQINLWACAVAGVATLLGLDPVRRRLPFRDSLDRRRDAVPSVIFGIFLIITVAILGWFFSLWGGLVPPRFQTGGDGAAVHAGGLNTVVAPYVLTLFFVYAGPPLIVLLPNWTEDRRIRGTAIAGAVIGLVIGLLLESAPGIDVGRNGGWLWTFAARTPEFAGRSSILVVGSMCGGLAAGAAYGLLVAAGRTRMALLGLGFALSFVVASSANAQVFQRYFDPPVLLALGWCLVGFAGARTSAETISSRQVAIAALSSFTMQACFAGLTLYRPLFSAAL